MSNNLSELSGRKGLQDNLFDRLGQLAKPDGTPSTEDLDRLAEVFLVGSANTLGAATFYDFLGPENRGKKVYVCNGTSCVCAGTQEGVNKAFKDHFRPDEIGHMTCLGRCHEGSAFQYDGKNYSGKALSKLGAIISKHKVPNHDQFTVKAGGKEILTKSFTDIHRFYAPFREALKGDSSLVLEEIHKSNIRGRGGAGFPTGLKLKYCRETESDIKFIIGNADEGDPGAYSDRYLLEERTHSVLLGMLISGYVTHANQGVLYIRAEYPEAVLMVQKTIDELRSEGLLGNNIDGSGFDFEIRIIRAQGSYLCGEETALINSIEGQRPEVRVRPPYPVQRGLFNKPTIVTNVETLAVLPYILEQGGENWAAIGTERSSGTKLVCLDSLFINPGIYELEMGTPLAEIVNDYGGGFKIPVKALQIGGPLGGLVPLSKVDDLTMDFESFSKNGFVLGHASIIGIPEDFSMIKFMEHLFDFAARESCGKCYPCRLGTKRGHELSLRAIQSGHKIDKELFTDLLTTLEKGSLCAHGGGLPLPLRNAMDYFGTELEPYFK